jgi:hypothetical protein
MRNAKKLALPDHCPPLAATGDKDVEIALSCVKRTVALL